MKYLINAFSIFILSLFFSFAKAQPACNPALVNLIVNPNQANYCVGANISFAVAPTGPIIGNASWTFPGVAVSAIASGTKRSLFDITGVKTGGMVTVTGVFNAPPQCLFTKTFMVNVPAQLIADSGPDQIYTSSALTLGTSPCCSGGTSPFTYLWAPNTGLSANNVCGPSLTPPTSMMYTLTVSDANGCISTDEVFVLRLDQNISYITPTKNIDGGYQVPKNGKVYFRFEEEYRNGTLNYKILDYAPSSANVQPINNSCALSPSNLKTLGDNRYSIDISACSLTASKFYLVEITNDKNEKFYFKFKS